MYEFITNENVHRAKEARITFIGRNYVVRRNANI